MSKKQTLYVNYDLDQFTLLDNTKLNIIHIDLIDLIHDGNNKPFVLLFNVDNNMLQSTYKHLFNIIDITRQHDLIELNSLIQLDIFKVPKYYYSATLKHLIPLILNIDTPLIFKSFNQARSMGKHIVNNGYDAIKLLKQARSILPLQNGIYKNQYLCNLKNANEIFNKVFDVDYGDIRDNYEKDILYRSVSNVNLEFILQEIVEFTTEYRILYMYGVSESEYIIEQREGYQPHSKEKRTHKIILYEEFIQINNGSEILVKTKELGNKLGYPAISLDIYYNANSANYKYGIFEYSTQFGIDYDKDILIKLSQQYTHAILLKIGELKNE